MGRLATAALVGTFLLAAFAPPVQADDGANPVTNPEVVSGVKVPLIEYAPVIAGDCCNPGDCNSCCGSGFWRVQASAVWLTRLQQGNPALLTDFVTGGTLFNASQFDFDWQPGIDVSLRGPVGAGSEFEVRYLAVDDWEARSPTFTFPASALVVSIPEIATSPRSFVQLPPGGTANLVCSSEFHSGEVNYWQRLNQRLKVAAGFRMFELSENLTFNFVRVDGVPFAPRYDWDVDNHLYGFQLGAEGVLWQANNFSLNGSVRAGICGNRADQSATFEQPEGTLQGFSNARDTRTAFIGEVGLSGSYRLTRNLSLRAGYQLLFVDGVALASEQVGATGSYGPLGPPLGPPVENVPSRIDSGSILYHGGNVGLELVW